MKKIEREKECERKKKQREKDGEKRGKGKKRQRQSSSDEASASDAETHQPSSSRTRSVRPPSRYRDEETADSDESDTVCIIRYASKNPLHTVVLRRRHSGTTVNKTRLSNGLATLTAVTTVQDKRQINAV